MSARTPRASCSIVRLGGGGGRVGARGPWGPLAPDVKVRGERIFHGVGSVGEALHGGPLAHSVDLGESRARDPWGIWPQTWGTRGEGIPHERIHVVSVTTYYRLTNLQTYKRTNLQTYKLTNLQTYLYIHKLTNLQTSLYRHYKLTNLQTSL